MISTLPTCLEEVVRPVGVAHTSVTFVDGQGRESTFTYGELAARIAAAAGELAAAGVEEGDAVATVMGNDLDSVVTALGVWAAGATLVSLPPPPARGLDMYRAGFAPVAARVGCRVAVGSPLLAEALGGVEQLLPPGRLLASERSDPVRPAARVALIQFTSGSLGAPKGVALSSDTLAGHVLAFCRTVEGVPFTDRLVTWAPLYHDMGLVSTFLSSFAYRLPLLVMQPAGFVVHPAGWLRRCESFQATMTVGSEFAFRLAARAQRGAALDLSRLRLCVTGGEPVSGTTLERFHAALGGSLRWEALTPGYGLAEASAAVTVGRLGRGPVIAADGAVSCGVPMEGAAVRVGETIEVGGSWLADGYVTADGTVPLPGGGEWFVTSDRGRLEEGELYVLGRTDQVVVTAGRNHFPEDVEAAALKVTAGTAFAVSAFRSEDPSRFALAIEVPDLDPQEAPLLARRLQGEILAAVGVRVGPVLVLRPWTIPRTTSGKVRRGECGRLLAEQAWPERKLLAIVG